MLVVPDALNHRGSRDPGFAAADGSGQDGTGLVVAGQDLGHAAVGDPQLAADVAGPHPELGQFHDPEPHRVGQRPSVNEHPAELVHLPVALLCTQIRDLVRVLKTSFMIIRPGPKSAGITGPEQGPKTQTTQIKPEKLYEPGLFTGESPEG